MKVSSVVSMVVIVAALAACSSKPEGDRRSNEDLAAIWGERMNGAVEARAELIRRKVFTPAEVTMIDNFQLQPGMNALAPKAIFSVSTFKNYLFDKKDGQEVGRHYVINCQIAKTPHCPYPWTTIDIAGDKVTGIRASTPGEIPRI